MKKAILIGTVVAILALGCLVLVSIVTNNLIEKNFSKFAPKFAKKSNIEVTDMVYEPSLTGSIVYTTIQAYGFAGHSQLKIKHEISTFPIYTKIDGSRGIAVAYVKSTISDDNFSPAEFAEINAAFNKQAPVILETIVDYRRNYNLSLTINPMEDRNKSQSFSGLIGNFKLSKDGKRITGQAKVQSFETDSEEGMVNLAELDANVALKKNNAGLWIGAANLNIARIHVQSSIGDFNFNQASIETNLVDRTETLEYLIDFVIKEINIPNGLPLAINSLNYRLNINNIDSLATPKILQAVKDMQHEFQSDPTRDREQFANQFTSQNAESIDRLLRANPHTTQNLRVATSQGSLELDLDLNFSGFRQDKWIAGIESPGQLIQYISGAFHAKSPLALLQLTPLAPELTTYQQHGLLKIEGDTALLNATLKDKQLTINEQQIPLQF